MLFKQICTKTTDICWYTVDFLKTKYLLGQDKNTLFYEQVYVIWIRKGLSPWELD